MVEYINAEIIGDKSIHKKNKSGANKEMSPDLVTMDNYNELENTWIPYLELDCLSLANTYSRHAMETKKISKVTVKKKFDRGFVGLVLFRLK